MERKSKRGFVVFVMAAMIVVSIAFLGLAIDVGYMQMTRQRLQTAADAAAFGAVRTLKAGGSSASVVAAGQADSAMNGFTHGQSETTVAINNPPVYGAQAGNDQAVEAVVTRTVPTMFAKMLQRDSVTLTARAVGMVGGSGGNNCIFALNKTVQRSLQIAGSNESYSACGMVAESVHDKAFQMEGSGTLYMKNGSKVSVVGGYDLTGQTSVRSYPGGNLNPPVRTADPGDPLEYLEPPTTSNVVRNTATNYDMNAKPANNTLQPGVYCGGLRIGNTGGATFRFAPGVYVIAGGGLTINSQAIVAGTGVTIYNTTSVGYSCASRAAFQPITIDGQAQVTLSAPTNGPLEGIAIFMNPNISDSRENKIVGGASTSINGAIYLKRGPLTFSGNNSSDGYMFLVADTIKINGNSNFNNNYHSLTHGSPIRSSVVLAE